MSFAMNGKDKILQVGIDSNIFIYHFERNEHFSLFTDKVFAQINQAKIHPFTSVISVTEALSYPAPQTVLDGILFGFTTLKNLRLVEVNLAISLEAARIRRTYGFRLPDSLHLATSLVGKVDYFLTNDSRLTSFKELEVKMLNDIAK